MRRAMSMPSASEASVSVWATAGWSPQASNMPTVCEPWPGKTNANEVIACLFCLSSLSVPRQPRSQVQQHSAPGEAAADAFEQHGVAALDLAAAHTVVECQRDRRSRRVAVLVDRD